MMEKAPALALFLMGFGSRCQDRDRIAMEQREASAALQEGAACGLCLLWPLGARRELPR